MYLRVSTLVKRSKDADAETRSQRFYKTKTRSYWSTTRVRSQKNEDQIQNQEVLNHKTRTWSSRKIDEEIL